MSNELTKSDGGGLMPPNPFGNPKTQSSGVVEMMSNREAAALQSMMVIAQKFPRNQMVAFEKIMQACQRVNLAEKAIYAYPRGGTTVSGPSIRLAEEIGKCWGNVSTGVVELETKLGETKAMAFAIDLETNYREERIFTVKHERKANDQIVKLTDPRDIYEMIANMGARRRRACLLAIIPADVVDDAVNACRETMKKGNGTPLVDRIKNMMVSFSEFGVNKAMLEKRLGHKIDVTSETEFVKLKEIFNSIDNQASKREDWFDVNAGTNADPSAAPASAPGSETAAAAEEDPKKKQDPKRTPKNEAKPEAAKTTAAAAESAATPKDGEQLVTGSTAAVENPPVVVAPVVQPPAAGTRPEPKKEAPENLARLAQQLLSIKCTEEQFLKYCASSGLFVTPVKSVEDMGSIVPKKLQTIVYDFEAKYGPMIKDWLDEQA